MADNEKKIETDKELYEHFRMHYDRVSKELGEMTMKFKKAERKIERLENTQIETPNFDIEIKKDFSWGWYEHKEHGEEVGGRFEMERQEDGTYLITDIEYCFSVHTEVMAALMQFKIKGEV